MLLPLMVRMRTDGTEVLTSVEVGLAPYPGVRSGEPTKVWGGESAWRPEAVLVVVRCEVVLVVEEVEDVVVMALLLWPLPLLS